MATTRPCWKSVGVWGDRSCHELATQVHCRNCPVLQSAASRVLDQGVAGRDLDRRATLYATPKPKAESLVSAVIFRIGPEWLALASAHWREVTANRPVRSLPHRRDPALLGLVNIRGRLVPCVSLHAVLGLPRESVATCARLAIVEAPSGPWGFPADEFAGVIECAQGNRRAAPATLGSATCIAAVFDWKQHTVGWLDAQRLWEQLEAVAA